MNDIIIELSRLVTVCFLAYLLLCALIVARTGSTASLADAGRAVHAFLTAIATLMRAAIATLPRPTPQPPAGTTRPGPSDEDSQ